MKTLFFAILMAIMTNASAQRIEGKYAIQNIQTGKDIRPYEAMKDDGNKVILYNHHWWKCMTWEFIHVRENLYQLKNRYTSKTFEPSSSLKDGVSLWQQQLRKDETQYWEFVNEGENIYSIRLEGTELYISISSEDTNSPIIMLPRNNSDGQRWRLVGQDPWF